MEVRGGEGRKGKGREGEERKDKGRGGQGWSLPTFVCPFSTTGHFPSARDQTLICISAPVESATRPLGNSFPAYN